MVLCGGQSHDNKPWGSLFVEKVRLSSEIRDVAQAACQEMAEKWANSSEENTKQGGQSMTSRSDDTRVVALSQLDLGDKRAHTMPTGKMTEEERKQRKAARNSAYHAKYRETIAEKKREYYTKNREAIAEKNRTYFAKNREAVIKNNREYYASNREIVAQKQREYRARNREALAEKRREYYVRNRDAIAQRKRERRSRNVSSSSEQSG